MVNLEYRLQIKGLDSTILPSTKMAKIAIALCQQTRDAIYFCPAGADHPFGLPVCEDSFLVPRKVRSAHRQGKGTRAHLKKTRLQVRTLPELSEKLPPTRSARVWLGLKGGVP